MAKSFKKKNVLKDAGGNRHKVYKKLSRSRVRQEVKRRIKRGEYDVMPLARELTNQWDVCDWKNIYSDFELKEAFRGMMCENQFIQQSGERWDYMYFHWRWYPRVGWYKGRYRFKR